MIGEPSDLSNIKHGNVYIMHSPTSGFPGLLISPQMLNSPKSTPGWFTMWMNDERELYKFAAQLMNKADELAKMRENGDLPPLAD